MVTSCSKLQRPVSGAILRKTTQRVSRMALEMMVLELERQEKKWLPNLLMGLPQEHFWLRRRGGKRDRRSFRWRRVQKAGAGRWFAGWCRGRLWSGRLVIGVSNDGMAVAKPGGAVRRKWSMR